jgi:hypothetical protein
LKKRWLFDCNCVGELSNLPYAENLRHVLSLIERPFIQGYADAEDDPEKQIELIPDAVNKAEAFLIRT